MKYIITENKMKNVILHFLNKGYGDLTEYKDKKYPNKIFYIRDKKIYMEHNLIDDELIIDDSIWNDLKMWFSLGYSDIQSVITKWVEESYNMRGVTPQISDVIQHLVIE